MFGIGMDFRGSGMSVKMEKYNGVVDRVLVAEHNCGGSSQLAGREELKKSQRS